MKITVAGPGRWGSFIAWYLNTLHHEVTLYGRSTSHAMQEFLQTRKSDLITLPNEIELSTNLSCIKDSEIVIISIPSQSLDKFCKEELLPLNPQNKIFVLCMKGIENDTCRRLSEIASASLCPQNKVCVWIGPGHVQSFTMGIPNCMVIDGEDEQVKHKVIQAFSGELIRFYYGDDLLGNEVGAASKNVIGIAAGILDGLKLSTLKGALMSRGTREISRLIEKMGGNPFSAYGLCHLGDYEATVFSPYSHNRQFGEDFILGVEYSSLAEGYFTAKSMHQLAKKYQVELPICEAVYSILYEKKEARLAISELFTRDLKRELQ